MPSDAASALELTRQLASTTHTDRRRRDEQYVAYGLQGGHESHVLDALPDVAMHSRHHARAFRSRVATVLADHGVPGDFERRCRLRASREAAYLDARDRFFAENPYTVMKAHEMPFDEEEVLALALEAQQQSKSAVNRTKGLDERIAERTGLALVAARAVEVPSVGATPNRVRSRPSTPQAERTSELYGKRGAGANAAAPLAAAVTAQQGAPLTPEERVHTSYSAAKEGLRAFDMQQSQRGDLSCSPRTTITHRHARIFSSTRMNYQRDSGPRRHAEQLHQDPRAGSSNNNNNIIGSSSGSEPVRVVGTFALRSDGSAIQLTPTERNHLQGVRRAALRYGSTLYADSIREAHRHSSELSKIHIPFTTNAHIADAAAAGVRDPSPLLMNETSDERLQREAWRNSERIRRRVLRTKPDSVEQQLAQLSLPTTHKRIQQAAAKSVGRNKLSHGVLVSSTFMVEEGA